MSTKETPKKTNTEAQKNIFSLGIVLFSIGIIGLIADLWTPSRSIQEILPEKTTFFIEGNVQKLSQKIDTSIPFFDFFEKLAPYSESIQETDIQPWIGKKMGFGSIEKKLFFAVNYRSKSKARSFLKETFLLPDESFLPSKTEHGVLYSPEFSGIFSFSFIDNWLVITEQKDTLISILKSGKKLSDIQVFKEEGFFSPIIGKGFFTSDAFNENANEAQSGLINTFGSLLKSGVFYVQEDSEKDLRLSLTLTTETQEIEGEKTVVPELAQFSDDKTLFFINGIDMYQTYLRTKSFLEAIHPELGIVFDGILSSESQEIFGPQFDFSSDFLSKMNGQYAVILDFDDPISPFLNATLITGFGRGDSVQKINEFHETLRFAQGKFSTQIETVELPNGKTRDELVATDPKEILIQEHKTEKGKFYTTTNPFSEVNISYGFLENYFIFSTNTNSVEKIFTGKISPLTKNDSFRNLVLLKEDPSESYGIMNNQKLIQILTPFIKETLVAPLSGITNQFPQTLFSRKIGGQKISWDFILTAETE